MQASIRITAGGIAITALIVAGSNTVTLGQSKSIESNRQKIIVVYATKAIPKNATIKDEDLQETWIYDGKSPQHRIQCRNFAVGNLAKYGIQTGQILVEEDIVGAKTKAEIKEGQIITNEMIEPARQKGEP